MQLGKIGTNIIRKAVVWAKTGKKHNKHNPNKNLCSLLTFFKT